MAEFRTANVTLMVADFDRTVRFYVETLGLSLRTRHGDAWAEVEAPGLTVGIHATPPGASTGITAKGLSLGLEVADLDGAVATLTGRGLTFRRFRNNGTTRFADFTDPDGTPWYLIQRGRE